MRSIIVLALGTALLVLWSCSGSAVPMAKPQAVEVGHPALDDQDMLIACADCHKEGTPEIYLSWFESGHGIGNVKCYQCHGTYENLSATPPQAACAVCHAAQFEHSPAESTCWQCHPAHTFNVHGH